MTIIQWTVQRVQCDIFGCVTVGPRSEDSNREARQLARDAGWLCLASGEDYCPEHADVGPSRH